MNARQSAGQINKIKWQTHYKASGSQAVRQAGIRRQVAGEWNGRAKWQRHGNKSATGSTCSNNATLAAQNTLRSTLHKKMANNARRSKGTMVAQHTTACRSYPPLSTHVPLPSLCWLLLLPASCCCCIVRLQWPNASGDGGVASIGALMPGDRREKLPAKWVCVRVCVCIYVCVCAWLCA